LTQSEDGLEITAEPGRGCVRVSVVEPPWNDEVLDFTYEIEDAGVRATRAIRTLNGDSPPAWTAEQRDSPGTAAQHQVTTSAVGDSSVIE
jgi:hypothetical protein